MTLPVFRAMTSGGDAAGTNLVVNAPTGLADGDILEVAIWIESTAAVSSTGWTEDTAAGGTNTGSPTFVIRKFWRRASGEGASWTFSWGGASVWRGYVCAAYYNAASSGTPNEQGVYGESEAGSTTLTGTGITTQGADRKAIFFGGGYYSSATGWGTPTNSATTRGSVGALMFLADADRATQGATGNYTIQWNNAESGRWSTGVTGLIGAGVGSSVEQEGYRWRNDDGSETAATWAANQDTAITAPLSAVRRLRMLLNATGAPAGAFRLEYRLGSGLYRQVRTADQTPSFVAAGAQVVTNTSGATLQPALPTGWEAGDLLVLVVAGRPNGSTISHSISGTGTWTSRGSRFREIGTGNTDLHIEVFTRVAASNETAPTVTPDADFLPGSTTGGVSAQIMAFRNVQEVLDVSAADSDSAAATTWTPTGVTTVTNNSLVLSCVATADDNALNFNTANSFSLAVSGASYDTTTGSDHAVGVGYYVQGTAGAVTMPVWNQSAVGSDAWVGVTIALRPQREAILLSASSNITAGGEATTAQLTAPASKTTSDFVTGRMWDDENGSDSISITTDDYTELEWCLTAVSGVAQNDDVYQFRVTLAGTALATYTVTPQWTIGSSSTPISSSDTAAVADAESLTVQPSSTDTAAAAEANSIEVAVSDSDTVAMAEAQSVGGDEPKSSSDTAAVAEAQSLAVDVASSDTAAVAEGNGLATDSTDTASAAETNSLSATVSGSDTVGVAEDQNNGQTTNKSASEAGALGEGPGWGLRFYGHGSGNIDRVRIPLDTGGLSTRADVGAGDFTYDLWLTCNYADNTSGPGIGDARNSNIFLDRDIWGHQRGWVAGVTRLASPNRLVVCFGVAGAGGDWTTIYGSTNIGDGRPHHIAIVRQASNGQVRIYVDGVQDASGTYTTGDLSYPDGYDPGQGMNNPYLVLGAEKHDAGGSYPSYNGQMDELRISDNQRWSNTFTPPTAPHTVDSNTRCLYHFNSGTGTTLVDTAGAVDGEILYGGSNPAGPAWVVSTVPLNAYQIGPTAAAEPAAVAESQTLSVLVSSSDTAAVSESQNLATGDLISSSDTAAAAESQTISAGLTTVTDPSAVAFDQSISATAASTDTAAAAESQVIFVYITDGDSLAAAETQALDAAVGSADTVGLAESGSTDGTQQKADSDSASLAETQSIAVTLSSSDSLAAAEGNSLVVSLVDGDFPSLAEANGPRDIAHSEPITFVYDLITLVSTISSADSAILDEIGSLGGTTFKSSSDGFAVAEAQSGLTVLVSSSDSAGAGELMSPFGVATTEPFSFSDTQAVAVYLFPVSSDSFALAEAAGLAGAVAYAEAIQFADSQVISLPSGPVGESIDLTLAPRSFDLTLPPRSFDLTLPPRM